MTFIGYVTLNGVKGLPLQNKVALISTAKCQGDSRLRTATPKPYSEVIEVARLRRVFALADSW